MDELDLFGYTDSPNEWDNQITIIDKEHDIYYHEDNSIVLHLPYGEYRLNGFLENANITQFGIDEDIEITLNFRAKSVITKEKYLL